MEADGAPRGEHASKYAFFRLIHEKPAQLARQSTDISTSLRFDDIAVSKHSISAMGVDANTFDVDVMSTMMASGSSFSSVALLSSASLPSAMVWQKQSETIRFHSDCLEAIPEESRQMVDTVIGCLVAAEAWPSTLKSYNSKGLHARADDQSFSSSSFPSPPNGSTTTTATGMTARATTTTMAATTTRRESRADKEGGGAVAAAHLATLSNFGRGGV